MVCSVSDVNVKNRDEEREEEEEEEESRIWLSLIDLWAFKTNVFYCRLKQTFTRMTP